MHKIARRLVVTFLSIALLGIAAPANASPAVVPPGWTKSTFIAAAAQYGVSTKAAEAAWGHAALMALIPVQDKNVASSSTSLAAQSSAAVAPTALKQYWGTCTRTINNVFGALVLQLAVKVVYNVNNAAAPVSSPTVTYSWQTAFGWYFNGLLDSQNTYSTHNGYINGAYTAKRTVKFTNDSFGTENRSIWESTKVNYTASLPTCNGGG